ncbi:hypothetical protein JW935_09950 [candidate division KSB1 bacterium]|nr:hypothetical protein [candidate division KSB1 bacterium]
MLDKKYHIVILENHLLPPPEISQAKWEYGNEDQDYLGILQREKAHQAADKMSAIGEMTSKISHEFRNALSSVKMILELLLENQLCESERNSLGIAMQGVEHMEHIIARLLHFSRPGPYNFNSANINEITETALSMCQIHFLRNDIELVKVLDDEIPVMQLDKMFIEEALTNLLLNAIHAVSSGNCTKKQITVKTCLTKMRHRVEDYSSSRLNFRLAQEGNDFPSKVKINNNTPCVLIQIIDSGPGIDTVSLERIFEPFFTQKPKGTGLGLSIVQQTVNAHGGIIKVNSVYGEGSTFDIFLPLQYCGEAR